MSVDRGGEIEFVKAYGLAHRARQIPNTAGTRFAIASGSKGLTALTVVSLIKDNALSPLLGPASRAPVVPAGMCRVNHLVIISSAAITLVQQHPHLVEQARGKLTLDASVQAEQRSRHEHPLVENHPSRQPVRPEIRR